MDKRSEFDQQLFHLRQMVLDGISYFTVWQALNIEYEKAVQTLKKEGLWPQFMGFLAPARKALFWSTLLQLSKVFDTDPRTISLNNLLIKARNDIKILAPFATQDGIEDLQVKIHKNVKLLNRLRKYRNKRLTHFDSEPIENIDLLTQEVNTLVDETKSIFSSLRHAYDREHEDFNQIMENVYNHTTKIISILNEAIKNEKDFTN